MTLNLTRMVCLFFQGGSRADLRQKGRGEAIRCSPRCRLCGAVGLLPERCRDTGARSGHRPPLCVGRTDHASRPRWYLPLAESVNRSHPGGNPGANLKSISHRCYLILVAFVWELTKETIHLPLGCLQGGVWPDIASVEVHTRRASFY